MSDERIEKRVIYDAIKKIENLKKDCKSCIYCNKINLILDELKKLSDYKEIKKRGV